MNASRLFSIGSIIAGFAAAILWFLSATVPLPVPKFDDLGPGGPFWGAFEKAARLNQYAAGATGLSILLSVVAQWFEKRQRA